jgi:hypothetical protein
LRVDERGLATLLLDATVKPSEVIVESTVPGVWVLQAGPGVASATNLLYGTAMGQLLDALREEYDVVLIDTPPMLQIPDARILARMAGGDSGVAGGEDDAGRGEGDAEPVAAGRDEDYRDDSEQLEPEGDPESTGMRAATTSGTRYCGTERNGEKG